MYGFYTHNLKKEEEPEHKCCLTLPQHTWASSINFISCFMDILANALNYVSFYFFTHRMKISLKKKLSSSKCTLPSSRKKAPS